MNAFYHQFLNLDIMAVALPAIAGGFLQTLVLSLVVIVTGLAVGLALALVRGGGILTLVFLVRAFSDIMRSLPPLAIIILWYFGLPYFGIRLSGFTVSWLVLAIVLAAFAEEIFWAGIKSIGKGQAEAARSTGLTYTEAMRFVILPQAIRLTIPPMTSRLIATMKHTALASAVATPDLLGTAVTVQGRLANTTPLTMAAVAYLCMIYPLVVLSNRVDRPRRR